MKTSSANQVGKNSSADKSANLFHYLEQGSNIVELWKKEKDAFAKELRDLNFRQVEVHSNQLINILEGFVALFLFRNPKGRPTNELKKYQDFRVSKLIHRPTISLYKQIHRIQVAVKELDLKEYIHQINEATRRMNLILENTEHIMENGLDSPKRPDLTALPKKITRIMKQLAEYERSL